MECAILDKIGTEGLTEEVTFEKTPEASEGVDQVGTLRKIPQERGNNKCQVPKLEGFAEE